MEEQGGKVHVVWRKDSEKPRFGEILNFGGLRKNTMLYGILLLAKFRFVDYVLYSLCEAKTTAMPRNLTKFSNL